MTTHITEPASSDPARRLIIVRHGEASFGAQDYDQLTATGKEQSQLLGEYLADRGMVFDRVYVGPKRRHRQTHDAVAAVYEKSGLPWPAPVETAGLDEHRGQSVLRQALPQLREQDEEIRAAADSILNPTLESQHEYAKIFQKVTRLWARGELESFGYETWPEFRHRVERAIDQMISSAAPDQTVIAFTSAGAVSAAVGFALGLDHEQTIETSWQILNASFTEISLTGSAATLDSFNAVPHLEASFRQQ